MNYIPEPRKIKQQQQHSVARCKFLQICSNAFEEPRHPPFLRFHGRQPSSSMHFLLREAAFPGFLSEMCLITHEKGMDASFSSSVVEHEDAIFQGTRHWRSMALDTLRAEEDSKSFVKGRKPIQPCSLTTEGIDLAQPAALYRFLNRGLHKVSGLTKTWDGIGKPHQWIPLHVNRSFNNLTVDDIQGARPDPKNMKLGSAARGTNPLEPVYKLPTSKDPPPLEPKFLRDNLNVEDISGAQPRKHLKFTVENLLTRDVIEGSFPGWRPAHRRRFGKAVRDLCLQVQDINNPSRRIIRNANSQAYLHIEGTNPNNLKQFQVGQVRKDHSHQSNVIQGTEPGSGTWMFNILRRKREGRERSYNLREQDSSHSIAKDILDTKIQGIATELKNAFKEMDRDNSGKLTISEVQSALKKFEVDLNPVELKYLASAFDTCMDGYVDYPKLLQTYSPCQDRLKRYNSNKLDSRCISLCLNQWIDRPWPRRCTQSGDGDISTTDRRPKNELDRGSMNFEMKQCSSKMDRDTRNEEENMCYMDTSKAKHENRVQIERKAVDAFAPSDSKSKNQNFPLQLGLAFWPEEKSQPTARVCLSLPQDNKEAPDCLNRPLSDDEKAWETSVGGTTFTGEGKFINHGSYMHGYDWSRPASSGRVPCKKRKMVRCPSHSNFYVPEGETGISTSRNEYGTSASKIWYSLRRPVSASVAESDQRPFTASSGKMQSKGFCTPRFSIMSPMSSRSTWSPRLPGTLSFQSTPRNTKEAARGQASARESLASRERVSVRKETARKEDAAAVRLLL